MIQLATDPNASRTWRAAPAEGKEGAPQDRRARTGHAWPFISQYGTKPVAQPQPRQPANGEHGS